MPFLAYHVGHIARLSAADIRRDIKRGRITVYADGFFYTVYRDEHKTQVARQVMARFYRDQVTAYEREQQQYHAKVTRQEQAEARAQRALSRRKTEHFREILELRGLDPNIPLHVLWLPRPVKHPRTVAHGWGPETVSAKQQ